MSIIPCIFQSAMHRILEMALFISRDIGHWLFLMLTQESMYRVVHKFWPGTKWHRMTLKLFYSSHFVVWTQNTTYREGFSTFLSTSTLCQDWLCWFLYITPEPELHAPYKRTHLDFFNFWVHFLTKKSKKLQNG